MVAACDYSMPRRKHNQVKSSMYWWNDQLDALRRESLTARRKFTSSKGDALLQEARRSAKAALGRGINRSRLQCWKYLIYEIEKDSWGLAFKIITKRLVTRRKNQGVHNPDRVKCIVQSLFPVFEKGGSSTTGRSRGWS